MSPEDLSPHPGSPPSELTDEETMLAGLRAFHPAPSGRFYKRMAAAPWNAARDIKRQVKVPWWRRPVFSAPLLLFFILFLLAVLSPPTLRATAQRFAQFFIRSPADQTSVEITPGSSGQLDYDFDQTIQEAEAVAGFPVLAPVLIPTYMQFNGAKYVPDLEAVFLDYRTEDSRQILRISQQLVDGRELYASIGVNAEVEKVLIGEVTGEYVVGGWKLPELATPLESAAPGVKITLEADWDTEGQIQILRWQEDDMLFEILSVTAPSAQSMSLTKADLLALAEGMQ